MESSSPGIVTCHSSLQRGPQTPRDELVKDTEGKWEEGAEVGRIITDEISARHRRRWSTAEVTERKQGEKEADACWSALSEKKKKLLGGRLRLSLHSILNLLWKMQSVLAVWSEDWACLQPDLWAWKAGFTESALQNSMIYQTCPLRSNYESRRRKCHVSPLCRRVLSERKSDFRLVMSELGNSHLYDGFDLLLPWGLD